MRGEKDMYSFFLSVSSCSGRHQVVSAKSVAAAARPLQHLARRIVIAAAWMVILATTVVVPAAVAQPYDAHTDVEFRLGGGLICGTCVDKDRFPWRIKTTAQVFVDRLFPVAAVGGGAFEIGPYVKGALLDGMNIPQIAGGVVFGYRLDNYEILVNTGYAYATERIGEVRTDRFSSSGQTKHTYDLGLSLRYDISRYFLSLGYQHNSNGRDLGLNFVAGKGNNYGYDIVSAGVGMHF
jgi:hypothetical protein